MSTVVVIGTYHVEEGACTSEKLLEIIEEISPEIIFCEAPPEVFSEMIDAKEKFNPPEIKMIREILEDHSIKIVPVDIHGIVVGDERIDEIFDMIFEKMENYKNAMSIQIDETYKEGYNFLNSKKNDKINFDKALMEREIIAKENNKELTLDYVKWVNWNNYRENHWIKLIHENFHENKFNTAVLLVGAGHRVGLLHKIMGLELGRKLPLSWNFYYL